MPLPKCPFCLDSDLLRTPVLFETEAAYATTVETSPGCYLLIPKTHAESLTDLPDNWWSEVKKLMILLPHFDNYNLSVNIGEQAGQKVKHVHFWLIPRSAGQPSSGKGFAKLIEEANAEAA